MWKAAALSPGTHPPAAMEVQLAMDGAVAAAAPAADEAAVAKPVVKPVKEAAPWDPNAWAAEPKKMPKEVPEAYRTYKDDTALMADATDDVTAVRGAVAAPAIDSLVYIKDGPVAYSSEKPTVICFWAKFAKGDYTTIVGVSDIADDFKEQANFVGISVDPNVDDAKGFLKKMGTAMPELDVKKCNANYPLAWDEDKKVKNAFMKACRLNSLGASATFIVDKKGNFIWREQFGQGYAPKKGQLREQLRRHCAGESLLSNGLKPVDEDDDEDLADGESRIVQDRGTLLPIGVPTDVVVTIHPPVHTAGPNKVSESDAIAQTYDAVNSALPLYQRGPPYSELLG